MVERDDEAFRAGREAARTDIAEGRLVYCCHGHAGHWGHWFVTQLAERFGVGIGDGFGVCFTTVSEDSFDDGYNEVLSTAISQRYGPGAIDNLISEARQQSEQSLWAAKESWFANEQKTPAKN